MRGWLAGACMSVCVHAQGLKLILNRRARACNSRYFNTIPERDRTVNRWRVCVYIFMVRIVWRARVHGPTIYEVCAGA